MELNLTVKGNNSPVLTSIKYTKKLDFIDFDQPEKIEFDSSQMFWIYKGLKNNNPFVRFYAKPKYNSIQMQRFYYDDSVDFEFRMFKKNLINFEYKFIKEYEYNKQKYNKFDRIGYFND